MKEPKRYYCGNGEGMFKDDKNGHWVEWSEHKAIVEELTQQLRKHVVSSMYCGCQQSQCYLMNGSYICATCNRPIGK